MFGIYCLVFHSIIIVNIQHKTVTDSLNHRNKLHPLKCNVPKLVTANILWKSVILLGLESKELMNHLIKSHLLKLNREFRP